MSRPETNHQDSRGNRPKHTLPLRRRVLFAAATLILFFVLLELTLALIGIEPAYRSGDPLVGFSRQLPHFVESSDASGDAVMTTAPGKEALNSQQFQKAKPSDTFRIVCLGGSTTYGRPFWDETSFSGWLRTYLPTADSSQKFEVINAGGISYASYRVLTVMEELAPLRPDLFVIYVGHNEFLERRTYGDLLNQPALFNEMRASAFRLRIATLFQRVAKGFSDHEQDKAIVLEENVKRIPVNAIGPEAYHRDNAFKEQVGTHFRLSLSRMMDVAEQCGAKVILVSPASNFRHAVPFKSEHRAGLVPPDLDTWRANEREAMSALESGDAATALTRFDACLDLDPGYAATHYHRGRALMELKRYDEARAAFAQAIEEDICPLRAIRPTLSALSTVAASRNVPLIDFQSLLEAQTAPGITGDEFFHDHLHLTIDANRLLALEILNRMGERKWLTATWTPEQQAALTTQLLDGLDHERYAEELCKLSYAMDAFEQEHMAASTLRAATKLAPQSEKVLEYAVPFYTRRKRFESVVALLEGKTTQSPTDRRALGALGDAYSNMERFADAAGAYRRLLALEPGNVTFLQQLGVALSRAGEHEQAAECLAQAVGLNPQSAHLQNNLGLALASGGQHLRAIPHYEAAVALMPSLSSAHYNWALSLSALGQNEAAIKKFTRVLELEPGHEGAQGHLRALQVTR